MHICISAQGAFESTYGGGQVYVRNLAYGLRDRGHEVTILEGIYSGSLHPRTPPKCVVSAKDGLRFITIEVSSRGSPDAQADIAAAVREALLTAAPDVVHANGLKRLMVRVCEDLNIPSLVTAHHGGLVCPAGTLLDYGDRICTRPLNEVVCTHCCARQVTLSPIWVALLTLLPGWLKLAAGRVLMRMPLIPFVTPALCTPLQVHDKITEVRDLVSAARFIIAPSQAIRAALLRNSADPERTVLVPHGVPVTGRAEPPARITGREVRFLYVGRLNHVKGLHVLIQAFDRISGGAELHVVGATVNRRERRYWASLSRQISRPNAIVEHGYLTGNALREIMTACDIVILPSICLEVFGLAVAEALALGRPVITTDSGGPAEQIRNGVDGIVVPPNDVTALADAMQRIVDNPHLVDVMAENIRAPFSMEQHLDALEGLYLRSLTERADGGSKFASPGFQEMAKV